MRNTENQAHARSQSGVIQRTRAKARTGEVATPMHKIKRLVTFGSPAWADQPGNESFPAVKFPVSRREPNEICNLEDCSYIVPGETT